MRICSRYLMATRTTCFSDYLLCSTYLPRYILINILVQPLRLRSNFSTDSFPGIMSKTLLMAHCHSAAFNIPMCPCVGPFPVVTSQCRLSLWCPVSVHPSCIFLSPVRLKNLFLCLQFSSWLQLHLRKVHCQQAGKEIPRQ